MDELNLKNFNIQFLQKFPMIKLKDTGKLVYDEEIIYGISKFNLLEKHTIQQVVTIDITRTPQWKNNLKNIAIQNSLQIFDNHVKTHINSIYTKNL